MSIASDPAQATRTEPFGSVAAVRLRMGSKF